MNRQCSIIKKDIKTSAKKRMNKKKSNPNQIRLYIYLCSSPSFVLRALPSLFYSLRVDLFCCLFTLNAFIHCSSTPRIQITQLSHDQLHGIGEHESANSLTASRAGPSRDILSPLLLWSASSPASTCTMELVCFPLESGVGARFFA